MNAAHSARVNSSVSRFVKYEGVPPQTFVFGAGVGIPPFLVGTMVIAFRESRTFGIVTSLITAAWVFDTFTTVCRRCPFYGTGKCGIPSLAVPIILTKQSAHDINERRVRLYFYADVAMIRYINFVYWHCPPPFPFVAVCSLID
ncbi:MAG: hypothetical protein NVSMB56_07350 [Pyrinomonadaceae bacterium]